MSVRNLYSVLHKRYNNEENAIHFTFKNFNSSNNKRKTPLKVYLKEHITNGAVGNKFCMQLARARFHVVWIYLIGPDELAIRIGNYRRDFLFPMHMGYREGNLVKW